MTFFEAQNESQKFPLHQYAVRFFSFVFLLHTSGSSPVKCIFSSDNRRSKIPFSETLLGHVRLQTERARARCSRATASSCRTRSSTAAAARRKRARILRTNGQRDLLPSCRGPSRPHCSTAGHFLPRHFVSRHGDCGGVRGVGLHAEAVVDVPGNESALWWRSADEATHFPANCHGSGPRAFEETYPSEFVADFRQSGGEWARAHREFQLRDPVACDGECGAVSWRGLAENRGGDVRVPRAGDSFWKVFYPKKIFFIQKKKKKFQFFFSDLSRDLTQPVDWLIGFLRELVPLFFGIATVKTSMKNFFLHFAAKNTRRARTFGVWACCGLNFISTGTCTLPTRPPHLPSLSNPTMSAPRYRWSWTCSSCSACPPTKTFPTFTSSPTPILPFPSGPGRVWIRFSWVCPWTCGRWPVKCFSTPLQLVPLRGNCLRAYPEKNAAESLPTDLSQFSSRPLTLWTTHLGFF